GEAVERGAEPDGLHEVAGLALVTDPPRGPPAKLVVAIRLELSAAGSLGRRPVGPGGNPPPARHSRGSPRSSTPYSTISSVAALPRCLATHRNRPIRFPILSRPMRSTVFATAPMSPAPTLRATRSSSRVSSVVTRRRVVTA